MKRIACIVAMLLPLVASAQSFQVGARASVGADWKISKGLHLTVEEEMRTGDSFFSLGSLRTGVGLDYKPAKFLRLGVGYVLINPYSEEYVFKAPRHRLYADVGAHAAVGYFDFSWKERFQYTHRTGTFNVYQNTPDAFALKSRLGVEYKGFGMVEPGLFFEVRTALNDPWGSVSGDLKTTKAGRTYYDYTPGGYTHLYNNRYRGMLRADIKLSKQHLLRPYFLLDAVSSYEIDTNSTGDRLFSAGYNNYLSLSLGVGYTYKF